MRFVFIIFLVLLSFQITPRIGFASTQAYESVNVKTVLWKQIDTCRKCWGKQDLLKAYARRVVQDLLPRRVPRNMPLLLQYLLLCWQHVPQFTGEGSMERYVLSISLADAIGGYLQAVALPIANEAYYAGNVDYKVMAQLYYLFEEIKMELGTDGGGWSKPCDMKRIATKVTSLDVSQIGDNEDPTSCKDLHIPISTVHGNRRHCDNTNTGNIEQLNVSKELSSCDTGCNKIEDKIPLPFLDDEQHPNAIAVPIKDQLLYSLHSMSSAHILVRYYMAAVKCIGKKDKDTLLSFNHSFYRWIIANVVPHLHEQNKWYVGFGSVMRIIETMHQKGWSPQELVDHKYSNRLLPTQSVVDSNNKQGEHTDSNTNCSNASESWSKQIAGFFKEDPLFIGGMVLLALLLLVILFLIIRRICGGPGNKEFAPFLSMYYKMLRRESEGKTCMKFDLEDNATGATLNTERESDFSVKYPEETDDTTTVTSECDEEVLRKRQ